MDEVSLLAIREDDDDSGGQNLYPVVGAESSDPWLESGEAVCTRFWAEVEQYAMQRDTWVRLWVLPEPCFVTVTDRRLVYVCRRFTKGSTWIGAGVVGVTLAGTAMAISAARARRRRTGRAAVGQVRYDWLANASLVVHDPASLGGVVGLAGRLLRVPPTSVELTINIATRPMKLRLCVSGPRPLDVEFVKYVAGAAAYRRLRTDFASFGEQTELENIASLRAGVSTEQGFRIFVPGSSPVRAHASS